MRGMIINTFLLLIIVIFLLIAIYFAFMPIFNLGSSIHTNIQKEIERGMTGNISSQTLEMEKAYNNVKQISPYLLVFSFILAVLIITALSEKGGG